MPSVILTNLGKSLIRTASGDASQVAITHVALGDGLGAPYAPSKTQATLRRELARRPIDRRSALGDDSWQTIVQFPANTPAFQVREIGFFTATNQLIAIWAGLDIEPRQTGVIAYLIEFVLNFDAVDSGLVIVEAPDDQYFDFAVVTLAGQAHQDLLLKQIRDRLA